MVSEPFDQLDSFGPEELERYQQQELERLTEFACSRSLFYRGRLEKLTLVGQLSQVPVLDRDQLLAASPPYSQSILTGPMEGGLVFKTGGTTGAPKFSLYSYADFDRLAQTTARTLWAPGLRPGDRVANCFAVGELYASFLTIQRGLEKIGALALPFTFRAPEDQVYDTLPLFGVNTVMGLATQMVHLLDRLAEARPPGVTIEKMFYAAEHLYPEDRQRVVEQIRPKVIATAGYGAVDGGMIGYQCPYCQGGVHHLLGGAVIVEIVDLETGRACAAGETGHLLVTSLERYLMPVIRYRVGDVARWLDGACPCGRAAARFELLGRGDDMLRIGYESVTYEDVRLALAAVEQLSSAIVIIKRHHQGKDELVVQAELRSGARAEADLMAQARQALLGRKPLLGRHIEEGYTHPLKVELVERGSLPRLSHSGKLVRVRDESLS